MADISDVEQALADVITGLIYPQGASQSSIVGVICRVYRGWPNAASLNLDLGAGVVNVTVIPDNEFGKTTTRYLPEWQFNTVAPSMTAMASGQTIEIGGIAGIGNVVGALVDGKAYAYRVLAGDTPALVAAILGSSMQTNLAAAVSGSRIYLPGANAIVARVVCDNMAHFEGRRQEKDLRVIFWCANPVIRDTLAAAVDLSIAQTSFLALPDDSSAYIRYRNSVTSDQSQNALLYRRDLVYCVEYPTVISVDLPSMLFGAAAMNGQVTFG